MWGDCEDDDFDSLVAMSTLKEKNEIVMGLINIGCFEVIRGNDNFTELQVIGSSEIFIRVERYIGAVVGVQVLCLEQLTRTTGLVQRKAEIMDILTPDLPDEIAEKIIFNLDLINELLGAC